MDEREMKEMFGVWRGIKWKLDVTVDETKVTVFRSGTERKKAEEWMSEGK
jgi:hypothetical protein